MHRDTGNPSDPTPSRAVAVTLDDLKSAVGSLVFLWSDLERHLAQAISGMPTDAKIPHTISQKLETWRETHEPYIDCHPAHRDLVDEIHRDLIYALRVRNGICHGRTGWRVDPHGTGGDGGLEFSLNGRDEVILFADLKMLLDRINGIRGHLGRLTFAASSARGEHLDGLYQDIEDLMAPKRRRGTS